MPTKQHPIILGDLHSIGRDRQDDESEEDEGQGGSAKEDGITAIFEYAKTFFRVVGFRPRSPYADNDSDDIEVRSFDQLDQCDSWDGDPEDEPADFEEQSQKMYSELENLMLQLLQPVMSDRVSIDEPLQEDYEYCWSQQDLGSYLLPQVWTFQLVTRYRQPMLIDRDDVPPPVFHSPISDLTNVDSSVNRYPTASIKVLKRLERPWTLHVAVEDQKMFCKLSNETLHESLAREYQGLQDIANKILMKKTSRAKRLCVPRLMGVIESSPGQAVGILIEYISAKFNLADMLRSEDGPKIEMTRRKKWASQIEHTIKLLHTMDVVWGDAKTSNILIDDNDDAWVIDFGGGQTIGWVDDQLVDTKEGDLQVLDKIFEALTIPSCSVILVI